MLPNDAPSTPPFIDTRFDALALVYAGGVRVLGSMVDALSALGKTGSQNQGVVCGSACCRNVAGVPMSHIRVNYTPGFLSWAYARLA